MRTTCPHGEQCRAGRLRRDHGQTMAEIRRRETNEVTTRRRCGPQGFVTYAANIGSRTRHGFFHRGEYPAVHREGVFTRSLFAGPASFCAGTT